MIYAIGKIFAALFLVGLVLLVASGAYAQTPSPSPPADDPILQACEACANRLKLAEVTLAAVQQQLLDARDIIAAKDKLLEQANGVIARYEKMTENSSKMQANSQRIETIDDRRVEIVQTQLAKAQSDLQSCKDSRPWIAGAGFFGGIIFDRTILNRFTGGSSNGGLFSFNAGAQAQQMQFAQPYPLAFYEQTPTEKALRSILKKNQ